MHWSLVPLHFIQHFTFAILLGVILPSPHHLYELSVGRTSGRVTRRNANSFAKMQSMLKRYTEVDDDIVWWCIRKNNDVVMAVGGPVPGISAQVQDVHCDFWSNVVKDQLDRDVNQ